MPSPAPALAPIRALAGSASTIGRPIAATLALAAALAAFLATSCATHRDVAPAANPATHAAETFFGTEAVYFARWLDGVFSHDERRVLVASDRTGTFNAFALPVDGGSPEQLTHDVDGSVFPVSWFPEDDRFLYERDGGGNERTVLWVRESDGSATALTPTEAVRARFMGWSGDGSVFWVATDERARPIMDLYRYSADAYERELIFRNDAGYALEGVSDDGRWIALQRVNSNTDTDLYLYDRLGEETVLLSPDVDDVRHRFMAFSSTEGAAYYGTDEFGEFQQVWRFDLGSKERTVAEAERKRCVYDMTMYNSQLYARATPRPDSAAANQCSTGRGAYGAPSGRKNHAGAGPRGDCRRDLPGPRVGGRSCEAVGAGAVPE